MSGPPCSAAACCVGCSLRLGARRFAVFEAIETLAGRVAISKCAVLPAAPLPPQGSCRQPTGLPLPPHPILLQVCNQVHFLPRAAASYQQQGCGEEECKQVKHPRQQCCQAASAAAVQWAHCLCLGLVLPYNTAMHLPRVCTLRLHFQEYVLEGPPH